jgi:hypothetical protein
MTYQTAREAFREVEHAEHADDACVVVQRFVAAHTPDDTEALAGMLAEDGTTAYALAALRHLHRLSVERGYSTP